MLYDYKKSDKYRHKENRSKKFAREKLHENDVSAKNTLRCSLKTLKSLDCVFFPDDLRTAIYFDDVNRK